jgi:sterol desaturase/sphingolipid hydroxylase (fatty acid hydroxylase superfamily)
VYSIKGFFQHSNVDTKLGWLNYIISGPELHRWHHSRIIRESNTNYGNNVIVWDILFGTFFLPKELAVGELGLINRNYPSTFMSQLKAPFIKAIDKTP